MPKWNSDGGIWTPRKERVALKRTNKETGEEEDYIYEGLDRGALKQLDEDDATEAGFIGQDFTENAEMYEIARKKGFDNVEDYVTKMGYNKEKAKAKAAENKKKVNTHAAPKKVKGKKFYGGGTNQGGNSTADIDGGFGAAPAIN